MRKPWIVVLGTLLLFYSLAYAATYTGTTLVDLVLTTPDGATEPVSILDDAIIEIKKVYTGTYYDHVQLTNSSGASTAVGDVLCYSTAGDTAAILCDTSASLQKYVVALQVITNTSTGYFARSGRVLAKTTGTIARGQYVKKSVTTLVIDDAGTAVSATAKPPIGTIGIALTAAASGSATIHLFDKPVYFPGITSATQDVATIESTTSTTYTDLATVGPAVTLTPGRATNQMIHIKAQMRNSATTGETYISVAIAGVAAVVADSAMTTSDAASSDHTQSSFSTPTSVADGSTHTMKYRVTANTGTYSSRRISAFTLN